MVGIYVSPVIEFEHLTLSPLTEFEYFTLSPLIEFVDFTLSLLLKFGHFTLSPLIEFEYFSYFEIFHLILKNSFQDEKIKKAGLALRGIVIHSGVQTSVTTVDRGCGRLLWPVARARN